MNGIDLLRCICHETRFEILGMLQKKRELCVSDFVTRLESNQPLVSHHLATLKRCGMVRSRTAGRNVMYSMASDEMGALISSITKVSEKMPHACSDGCC